MTIIALDIGSKRVGVAISHLPYKSCSALTTLDRGSKKAESSILKLIEEFQIQTVVVGLPLDEQGKFSEQCEKVRQFCERLVKRANIKIEYVDEWGSSLEAKEQLGLPEQADRKTRKSGVIDSQAASIILRKFLDKTDS